MVQRAAFLLPLAVSIKVWEVIVFITRILKHSLSILKTVSAPLKNVQRRRSCLTNDGNFGIISLSQLESHDLQCLVSKLLYSYAHPTLTRVTIFCFKTTRREDKAQGVKWEVRQPRCHRRLHRGVCDNPAVVRLDALCVFVGEGGKRKGGYNAGGLALHGRLVS